MFILLINHQQYVGTIGFCVDFDNGKFYVSHNGNFFDGQDPVNGVTINDGGIYCWRWSLGSYGTLMVGENQTWNFNDPDGENNYTDSNEVDLDLNHHKDS